MLFLLGVSLIFGVTGTLNMAVLAEIIPTLPGHTRALLHAGAAILGVALLIKTAMWPLGFWLPRTYAAATPAVAAMFALMTKVGIYVLLRLSLLLFGGVSGASSHFGSQWLLWGGVATMIAGTVGMLGARDLGKLAGYNVIISSGTLLGAIGLQHPGVTAGALAYLVMSTLGIAAFFLVVGMLTPDAEEKLEDALPLEPYESGGGELRGELFAEEDESRVVITAPIAMLGICFLACAVLLAGLPPLAGFLAKFALLAPVLEITPRLAPLVLFTVIIAAGFCTLIAMCRAGIQIFWAEPERHFPRVGVADAGRQAGDALLAGVRVHHAAQVVRVAGVRVRRLLADAGDPDVADAPLREVPVHPACLPVDVHRRDALELGVGEPFRRVDLRRGGVGHERHDRRGDAAGGDQRVPASGLLARPHLDRLLVHVRAQAGQPLRVLHVLRQLPPATVEVAGHAPFDLRRALAAHPVVADARRGARVRDPAGTIVRARHE